MFNDRGFHATSLDDVAASLGVTKPVIYHYLGNKDQVLFECVRLGLTQIREAVVAARARQGTGLDRLKAFLRRYAEIHMDDFGRCVIRTGEETLSAESRRKLRAIKREIDREMREAISEGIADGSIHAQDVRLTAFTLAGALNWPARWFDPDGPENRRDVAAAMVEILCEGLRRRDPAR
jgi:AcrR family transcriptional regulator